LDFKKVKEFTILPKNGEFYLECSYETPLVTVELDVTLALSIDLGTSSNLMAGVDTLARISHKDFNNKPEMPIQYGLEIKYHHPMLV